MKKIIIYSVLIAIHFSFAALLPAQAQNTKYASGSTSATVNFGADPYKAQEITSILAKSDKSTATVKLYGAGGAGKVYPSSTPTNGAVLISVTNDTQSLTNNDAVIYQHADGTLLKTTVSSSTTSSVTLATGITQAGAEGDAIYELTQIGELSIGTTALNLAGYTVAIVPPGSPLSVVVDGNTNCNVTATQK